MDQTDSDADERAEKSTSLNDVYVYVSHKNGTTLALKLSYPATLDAQPCIK